MPSQRKGESHQEWLLRCRVTKAAQRRAKDPLIGTRRNASGEGRNPDRKRANAKTYRERHAARLAASMRITRAKNPDLYARLYRERDARRRARRRGAATERVDRQAITVRDKGHCHICLRPVARPQFDHLIPLTREGAYAEWNLMLAHESCNKSRKDKQILPVETRAAAEAYIVERIQQYAA